MHEVHYLIDYENVHSDGLAGCESLSEHDHIMIFFTEHARNIDMSDIFDHGDASLAMEKVPVGHQSADMHIVSYLGYLAGKYGNDCEIVIISNDTDFDNVIEFWKKKTGITASRRQQIKPIAKTETKPAAKTASESTKPVKKEGKKAGKGKQNEGERKTQFNRETMQAIKNAGFGSSVVNTVAQLAARLYNDDNMLSGMHNALQERYPKYLDIYRAVKPVLSRYTDDAPAEAASGTHDGKQDRKNNGAVTPEAKMRTNVEIQKALSKAGYTNEVIAFTASAAVSHLAEKDRKQLTYLSVVSQYGQEKGLEIYNHIKRCL